MNPGSIDNWGEYRFRRLVVESISLDGDRIVKVIPSPRLVEYSKANQRASYAVFDSETKNALQGSSGHLLKALESLNSANIKYLRFNLPPNLLDLGTLKTTKTNFGTYLIATYGYKFSLLDIPDALLIFFNWHSFLVVAPSMLGSVIIAYVLVYTGMSSLRQAMHNIHKLDINNLNMRINSKNAPTEIAKFIDSINLAINKLEKNVDTQKRFAATVAHELRTPIAIMLAHCDAEDNNRLRDKVKREVHRVQVLVEQLLAEASIAYRYKKDTKALDVSAAVIGIIADLTPLIIRDGKSVDFECSSGKVYGHYDRWALECIISNLILNALESEPSGGVINVRLLDNAVIEVIDHGHGISTQDRDSIFDPFWRKSASTGGIGLGLAISRNLVESMDGEICVEDTPGGGATFRIFLRCG
jgi:signal transduction histidine kinase